MGSLFMAGVLALAAGLSVTPAAEAEVTVVCHGGSLQASLNPGVTFKRATTQVTFNGDLGVCSSEQNKKITGGVFQGVAAGTGNCPGPIAVGQGRLQVSWNDGSKTVVPAVSLRLEPFVFSIEGGDARIAGRSTTSAIEMGAQCVTSGLATYTGGIDSFALGAN